MELEFIEWLRASENPHRQLSLGIGDDAALWRPTPGLEQVLTTDLLLDGVHFDSSEHSAKRIGRKAVAVNLSDLAAMGAQAKALLISVAFPTPPDLSFAQELYSGIRDMAARFDVVIAGGDTNTGAAKLVISITAIGEVEPGKAWLRDGAEPGDAVIVTGQLGGSILGHHLDFTPRLDVVEALSGRTIHAATDITDGLLLDLWHVCHASGCGAELQRASIPISPAALDLSQTSGKSAWDHACSDGEDFELILAIPETEWLSLQQTNRLTADWHRIGTFQAASEMTLVDGKHRTSIQPQGYEH